MTLEQAPGGMDWQENSATTLLRFYCLLLLLLLVRDARDVTHPPLNPFAPAHLLLVCMACCSTPCCCTDGARLGGNVNKLRHLLNSRELVTQLLQLSPV
jgi:hypothetical protein